MAIFYFLRNKPALWLMVLCAQAAAGQVTSRHEIISAYHAINVVRGKAGLQPVAMSEPLSMGCDRHAKYLSLNKAQLTEDDARAPENKRYTGYTEIGSNAAGHVEVFAGETPAEAVARSAATFYHRIPLLQPGLKNAGIGDYATENDTMTLMDLRSGLTKSRGKPVVFFPAGNQQFVPVNAADETPGKPNPYTEKGFPITITFTESQEIDDVAFRLTDAAGAEVACRVSDPKHPLSDADQMNTVCAIPNRPLALGTTYTVVFSCTADGKPFAAQYHFSTAPAIAGGNGYVSPLSKYSPFWNDESYAKCNTAANAAYMTDTERHVIYILNLVRTNPRLFAESVMGQWPDDDNGLIQTLDTVSTLGLLFPDSLCYVSALCHASSSGASGYMGHDRQSEECEGKKHFDGECCAYGSSDALSIVCQLLIDKGVPSLGHRIICLYPTFRKLGVSIQPHTVWRANAVLDFGSH